MNARVLAVVLGVAAAAFAVGYRLGARPPPSPEKPAEPSASPVVARWSGGELTADALRARVLALKGAAGVTALDPARARGFADQALQSAVLASEARRRGLDADPKVQGQLAEVLARRLVELEVDSPKNAEKVAEGDVAAWYEKHRAEFQRPERVRLSELWVDAKDKGKLAALKKRPGAELEQAFAAAAADAGALPPLSRAELDQRVGPDAAGKLWLMVGVGELSDVIEAGGRARLFRLDGREASLDVPLEKAREQIKSRLWYERRENELHQLVSGVQSKLGFSIDEQALTAALADVH